MGAAKRKSGMSDICGMRVVVRNASCGGVFVNKVSVEVMHRVSKSTVASFQRFSIERDGEAMLVACSPSLFCPPLFLCLSYVSRIAHIHQPPDRLYPTQDTASPSIKRNQNLFFFSITALAPFLHVHQYATTTTFHCFVLPTTTVVCPFSSHRFTPTIRPKKMSGAYCAYVLPDRAMNAIIHSIKRNQHVLKNNGVRSSEEVSTTCHPLYEQMFGRNYGTAPFYATSSFSLPSFIH